MALSFLIVEDETTLRRALGRFLKNEGHEVAEAAGREPLDLPLDDRPAAHGKQRLRHRIGERTQAFAAPGGQDERARHQNV